MFKIESYTQPSYTQSNPTNGATTPGLATFLSKLKNKLFTPTPGKLDAEGNNNPYNGTVSSAVNAPAPAVVQSKNNYVNYLANADKSKAYTYGSDGQAYNYAGEKIPGTAKTVTNTPSVKNTMAAGTSSVYTPPASTISNNIYSGFNVPGGGSVDTNGNITNTNTAANTPTPSAADTAFQNYLNALTMSSDEINSLTKLNNLKNQAPLDAEKAAHSGETSPFAAGEEERVNRNNNLAIDAATNSYNLYKSVADNNRNIAKEKYDYEVAKDKAAKDALAAANKANEPFTLKAGEDRYVYNAKTGKYEIVGAMAPKVTATSKSSGGTKSSSTTSSMSADVGDVIDFLQSQKEQNNWKGIDPTSYQKYRSKLLQTKSGDKAVALLDKEMKARGLSVDTTDYNKKTFLQKIGLK